MMMYRLYTSGLDEEDATRDFATREVAIAYAAWWFLDGYMDEERIQESPDGVLDDVEDLIRVLKEGREFCCGRFYERARLEELPAALR